MCVCVCVCVLSYTATRGANAVRAQRHRVSRRRGRRGRTLVGAPHSWRLPSDERPTFAPLHQQQQFWWRQHTLPQVRNTHTHTHTDTHACTSTYINSQWHRERFPHILTHTHAHRGLVFRLKHSSTDLVSAWRILSRSLPIIPPSQPLMPDPRHTTVSELQPHHLSFSLSEIFFFFFRSALFPSRCLFSPPECAALLWSSPPVTR